MRKTIKTKDTEKLFEALESDSLFSCQRTVSGLNVKYNAVFTAIGNPKINLIKQSDTEIVIDILPNFLMISIAAIITLFFWAIGILAIVKGKQNYAGIMIAFLSPSVMWIVEYVYIKQMSKIVIEEIEKRI